MGSAHFHDCEDRPRNVIQTKFKVIFTNFPPKCRIAELFLWLTAGKMEMGKSWIRI